MSADLHYTLLSILQALLMCSLLCLQVGNVDMLNCYYAHADREDGLQVSDHASAIPFAAHHASAHVD